MSRTTVARMARPVVILVLALILVTLALPAAAQLPTEFDWRDVDGVNFVSSVKYQAQCGTCFIFSSVAMVESRWMIQLYNAGHSLHEIDLSEQYIMDCGSGYYGDFGCTGGGMPYDVLIHLRDIGAPFEDCYEYVAADGACPTDCPDSDEPLVLHTPVQSAAYHYPYWDKSEIMNEIYTNGPVVTHMDLYEDFYSYSGGVYEHTAGASRGSGAVLIVGWGVEGSTPYWICKLAWNDWFGEAGYFRIRRGVNECSITEYIHTAEVSADVSATPDVAPAARVLAQNVPNPFNPSTEIVYALPVAGSATLAIFDLAGRRARVLADGDHEAGREYAVTWNGCDTAGRRLPSGVYFYRLDWTGGRETRRMVLMK